MKSFLHGLTDRALVTLLQRGRLYSGGFGDRARLARLVEGVRVVSTRTPIDQANLQLESKETHALGVRVRRARFRSPLATELPTESKDVVVEILEPTRSPSPAFALLLAATAEEGFNRRRLFAAALLRRGIGVVSMENAFYGARRPRGQSGAFIATVADQFAMNLATVLEARALVQWMRAEFGERVVVTGFSQGAMMAAFTAVTLPFPIGVVAVAAALDAAPIFLDGVLARAFDWDALSRDANGLDKAKALFAESLVPVSFAAHPPPARTDLAVVMGAEHDGFVARSAVERLHAHWPGSELRWIGAGHVTAAALHTSAHRRAIRDVLDRFF